MELLNNIWTAFSTPNETLLNILTFPLFFVENYLTLLLFTAILNLKTKTIEKLKYVIPISIISIVNIFIIPNPFNIILNYFWAIIFLHFILKISFIKSIIAMIVSALIFNIMGALLLNPYIKILNVSTESFTTIPIYRIPYILLIYTTLVLIIFLIRNRHIKVFSFNDFDSKIKYIIISNLILGAITIIVQSIVTVYYTSKLPLIITFFSFLSLLAYLILSIYSLTKALKLISTTQKLESAEEYNNTLHILHDNVRGFKHDFDNIITTIGGYIKTDDLDGLKKYYSQLEDDAQRVNNLYLLNPDVINNDGIYNLLTKKYNEAEEKDIKINMTFLLDLNNLNMKIYEFARILGILLDNAIEASSECEEKIINITFKDDPKNSRQLVIIENTFNNPEIDTDKIFEKGFSEKEDHTGLGLWEVNKLIKKNKNINLFTSKKGKLFSQQLEIYTNK